ncbi:TRAP transporter large permease [Pseudorhodoplanes sp.]|uniref:TRAP transporter large permease n=1 Tax=Pseudorhodoplanes sp. TaxID=1934341 RepID=UPI003919DD9C
MSPQVIGLFALAALFVLIVLRVPVAIAMGLVGLVGYAAIDGWPRALIAAGQTPYDLANQYSLTVVPLFVLMGVVASRSGMSQELYRAANALFSGFRGALAMGTVGACAGFGAICGSSLATAATMTRVAIPEMRRFGYDERIATGVVASAGILGVLIPPSVVIVVYAIIAEQGVPQLFAAALFPGLLCAFLHLVVIAAIGWWQPERLPQTPGMSVTQRLRELLTLWKLVILFGIAVGGIYSGFMSPTEAAAVAAFVAIVIAFATRSLTLRGLLDALLETVWTTSILFFIIVGAFLFSYFVVLTQLPNALTAWVQGLGIAPWGVMLLLVGFYLVLGCFLDAISMILITVPVFLPLAVSAGYDPVWFGILVLVAVEIGMITPPVGLNIFIIRAQMPDIALGDIFRGIVPFLFAHLALVLLLIMFPALALWLPSKLY